MCRLYSLLLGIAIYYLGFVITYIVTKKRANWVISNKTDIDRVDEETGVFMFSILSFFGLVLFLLIRMISITVDQINKLFKL